MRTAFITIPKRTYQELRLKALAFERYITYRIKKSHLKELEKDLIKTGLYKNSFIKSLLTAEKDHLEGNVREVRSLKELI